MKFLSTLAARSHHCAMFESDEALRVLCQQVILPNLFLRGSIESLIQPRLRRFSIFFPPIESDIEEFEDNPEDYIRKDIEKSGLCVKLSMNSRKRQFFIVTKFIVHSFIDSTTRRRAACDFLQALCVFFEGKVVALFSQYIEAMQKVDSVKTTLKSLLIFPRLSGICRESNEKLVEKRCMHLLSLIVGIKRRNTKGEFRFDRFKVRVEREINSTSARHYQNKFAD